jgi:hypothetical protein
VKSHTRHQVELKNKKSRSLDDDIKALEDKLKALDEDPIMRVVDAIYQDRVRKAKADFAKRRLVTD